MIQIPVYQFESIWANILRKVYRDNLTSPVPRNTRFCLWSSWTSYTPISFCYRWSYRFPDRPCTAECSPRCHSGCRRDAKSTSVCPDRNCAPNSRWCVDGARTRDYRIPWLGHWSTLVSSPIPRWACSFCRPYRSPFSRAVNCQALRISADTGRSGGFQSFTRVFSNSRNADKRSVIDRSAGLIYATERR